ncbi:MULTISPECIES: DRTGG domain-containing protein [unclassified Saccharicrinis]|uniref:DRTGG domain-containing protein n=1 Tax=unclassified Saccharicrinis TaxID=2646859 RepID=UPI003D34F085
MKIKEIVDILDAKVVCGDCYIDTEINYGFASDLMSDVLTLDTDKMVLITGLANMQTIRTVEMADVNCIVFVRNKQVSPEMLALAQEEDLVLLQCKYSMYNAVGKLFTAGLSPVY